MKRYWAEFTSEDFATFDVGRMIAVLPVAAIEAHGPHLPLETDTTINEAVVAAAIPKLPKDLLVGFLPTQRVGKSNEHARYPGTLTFTVETLIRVWMEIGGCVAASGVRKLLLLNSHGGQISVMDIVGRDLRAKYGMLVVSANTFTLGLPEGMFAADELLHGIHGGDKETSMMLALRPDLVKMEKAQHFHSLTETMVRDFKYLSLAPKGKVAWQSHDLNPLGAAGDATIATAEKGRKVVDYVSDRLVELLVEIDRAPLSWFDNEPAWSAGKGKR
jgi:creatinine amidohydrolase